MGLLIAVEGLDGCGKTTVVIPTLLKLFEKQGHTTSSFHALKNTPMGDILYPIHCGHPDKMSATSQQLLASVMFRENVERNVRPALLDDQYVIMDRWASSTEVYQKGSTVMDELIRIATDNIIADYVVFCDISHENSIKRVGHRGNADPRDASNEQEFNQRRLDFIKSTDKRVAKSSFHLDCNGTEEEVKKQLKDIVDRIATNEKRFSASLNRAYDKNY